MITKEELRIGNWISFHEYPVQVMRDIKEKSVGVSIANKYQVDPGPSTLYKNLGPIELSPELLIKCGFNLIGTNGHWNEYSHVNISGQHRHATFDLKEKWLQFENTSEKIYSLHKLQNKYKELTGKELEINLAEQ